MDNKEKLAQSVIGIFDTNKDNKVTEDELKQDEINNNIEEDECLKSASKKVYAFDFINDQIETRREITRLFKEDAFKRLKTNWILKLVFFIIVSLILLSVVIGTITGMSLMIKNIETIQWKHVAVIVSAVAGLITAIAAIPTVIAKYLFPPKENEFLLKLLDSNKNIENYFTLNEKYLEEPINMNQNNKK